MYMKNCMNELTEGMQRLCAVANRVVNGNGEVSRIEVDLLLDNLRRLYDVALQLGENCQVSGSETPTPKQAIDQSEEMMAMVSTMAAMRPVEPEEPETPEIPEKPEKPEIPETPEIPEEPEPVMEPEPVVMPKMEELEQNDNALLFDEVIIEPEVPEVPEVPEPQAKPEEVQKKTENVEKPASPAVGQASLLDYLNQPVMRTIGESLGAERPRSNSLERKVDDLRTVININDKFSFMSELFHNNMKAYNDFIMHLNALSNRDEALAHVRDVAQQHKWDDASATVQAFYKIFDKKF